MSNATETVTLFVTYPGLRSGAGHHPRRAVRVPADRIQERVLAIIASGKARIVYFGPREHGVGPTESAWIWRAPRAAS
jgi:hypothetical protein